MNSALMLLSGILPYIGVTAAAITFASFIIFLLWFIPKHQTKHLGGVTDKERFELEDSARTTLAQIVGGVFVLFGIFATWYTVKISQSTLEISQKNLLVAQDTMAVTRESQLTDRFTKAINQLGEEQIDVRLGGIYALERLANESPEDRTTIVEVMTAFVRTHAPINPQTGHRNCRSETLFGSNPRNTQVQVVDQVPGVVWPPRDVRTILQILGKGTFTGHAVLGLSNTDLECAFLEGFHLEGAEMEHTHLENASLRNAHLDMAFMQSVVATNTMFDGATLRGADLGGARLDHSLNINCEQLASADTLLGSRLPPNCKEAIEKKEQEETSFLKLLGQHQ